jgi:dTDP-4-amino-4,6-dideoxygalactose transaminase
MTNEKIWLSSPHMSGEEIKFVNEAFETNWVSPAGPHLLAFENALSAYVGVPHCAALSSGTAAIHLALIILGISRGDEVICSSFTFSGSCNPIVYIGATPVFVDSESTTWNMDPELLEACIVDRQKKTGKAPKAMIVVHLYGMPARLEKIMEIARRFNIPVIEDAAEALGSNYMGRKLGSFGDIGIFSFNGNKIITTSGGGAMVSENSAWIEKSRFLATQARDNAPHYQHSEIGYNYRLSNVCAGIGRGQLTVIENRVAQRRAIYKKYQGSLSTLRGILFTPEPPDAFSNRWLTTILIEKEMANGVTNDLLRKRLEAVNIESRPLWKPMHLQPVFSGCPAYVSGVSERLFQAGLCLPSGSNMTDGQIDRIISEIFAVFKGI